MVLLLQVELWAPISEKCASGEFIFCIDLEDPTWTLNKLSSSVSIFSLEPRSSDVKLILGGNQV
jgi:hypothetical protein